MIKKLGGVDICFGGIGINGHVAFNEASDTMTPDEVLAQHTRVLEISKETRAVNSIGDLNGALDDMPHYCITIGINEIAHARKIRLKRIKRLPHIILCGSLLYKKRRKNHEQIYRKWRSLY